MEALNMSSELMFAMAVIIAVSAKYTRSRSRNGSFWGRSNGTECTIFQCYSHHVMLHHQHAVVLFWMWRNSLHTLGFRQQDRSIHQMQGISSLWPGCCLLGHREDERQ